MSGARRVPRAARPGVGLARRRASSSHALRAPLAGGVIALLVLAHPAGAQSDTGATYPRTSSGELGDARTATPLGAACHEAVRPDRPTAGERDIGIPRNLDEALRQLHQWLGSDLLDAVARRTEADLAAHHFGLGLWIRNCWGLWSGSPLARYFRDLDITHPDDMSAIVLRSLWRELNGHPIDLADQLAVYRRR